MQEQTDTMPHLIRGAASYRTNLQEIHGNHLSRYRLPIGSDSLTSSSFRQRDKYHQAESLYSRCSLIFSDLQRYIYWNFRYVEPQAPYRWLSVNRRADVVPRNPVR